MTEARTLAEAKKYASELITLACMEALEQNKLRLALA
jgi:DNA replication protein DnaD